MSYQTFQFIWFGSGILSSLSLIRFLIMFYDRKSNYRPDINFNYLYAPALLIPLRGLFSLDLFDVTNLFIPFHVIEVLCCILAIRAGYIELRHNAEHPAIDPIEDNLKKFNSDINYLALQLEAWGYENPREEIVRRLKEAPLDQWSYTLSLIRQRNEPKKEPEPEPAAQELPLEHRTSHQHILAGSGHGKSSLIVSQVLSDLKHDAAIVVIDSQNDLINKLAQYVPAERLVYLDPQYCPPALNIFATKPQSEQEISTALELYEYIFSAISAGMTSKQSLVYRFVSRLLLLVPGSSIVNMMEILSQGVGKYTAYVETMSVTARSFFGEFETSQYKETRQEILRRLYTVLENDTFARMLSATENKFSFREAIEQGKVILVSTNKPFLKDLAASLLGRIFIAQTMQAVMMGKRKQVFLYIDEFQDYAEDSQVLFNLFEQSRKYNLGITIAHQTLNRLPDKLVGVIHANTAIKMAGGTSAEDSRRMAAQMGVDKEDIDRMKKGEFLTFLRGMGAEVWHVPLGGIRQEQKVNDLHQVRRDMFLRYGAEDTKRDDGPAKENEEGLW